MSVLNSYIFRDDFIRAVKSGFYLDFFFKKICEVFIRNVFICSSYIFGEKYMIEFLTKMPFEKLIINLNIFWESHASDKKKVFITILLSTMYLLSLMLVVYILYF
jgi:hypothetical protein